MPENYIHIQETVGPTPDQNAIEIVERKGLGHPDAICALVMERIRWRRRMPIWNGSAEFYSTTATPFVSGGAEALTGLFRELSTIVSVPACCFATTESGISSNFFTWLGKRLAMRTEKA